MHASASLRADIDLSRLRFLVMDDKSNARDMVHAALAGKARAVKQTANVEKALDVLNNSGQEIDCIVAEWDMLPVGGLELLRMVRCRTLPKVDPRTPFVIFTSRAESAAVKCAVELDVNGFATAPLSLDKLTRTILNALQRTWLLQDAAHYASVPCIVPRPRPVAAAPTAALGGGVTGSSPFSHVERGHRPAHAKICGLGDIQPGAILARDIRDAGGSVILRTGTPLDPALIEGLRRAAGAGADAYHVWVRR